jgi:hypothetical protein
MVCSSPIKREKHGNQQEIAEKMKEIRWVAVHAANSYFSYSVW